MSPPPLSNSISDHYQRDFEELRSVELIETQRREEQARRAREEKDRRVRQVCSTGPYNHILHLFHTSSFLHTLALFLLHLHHLTAFRLPRCEVVVNLSDY